LSLANPAVGTFQLQNIIEELDIGEPDEPSLDGKILYSDYIQGGLAYGVEGTLLTMCDYPNQGNSDPFGDSTVNVVNYQAGNSEVYSFASFTSSKKYLESTDGLLRKALLEYFYKNRQPDLKRWLSNPSVPSENSNNYLGFPTSRNISLFPEWDLPINDSNWQAIMNTTNTASPEVTWWMWLEGVSSDRPYAYVPGAVPSDEDQTHAGTRQYLNKRYQQGFGKNTGKENLEYFTITCSKRFEIILPSWCTDYDVMADYANCIPFTASITNDSTNGVAGISINKGPVFSLNGENRAVFTINTTSTPLPPNGMMGGGKIMDQTSNSGSEQNAAIEDRLYQWLSYSIITPQFVQTK